MKRDLAPLFVRHKVAAYFAGATSAPPTYMYEYRAYQAVRIHTIFMGELCP